MKVAVVIAAAGVGKRMGKKAGKQFISLSKKPILAYTLKVFVDSPLVSEIVLVVTKQYLAKAKKLVKDYKFSKIKAIVAGGKFRQQSVYNGLKKVSPDTNCIMVHDGARPFVSKELIDRSLQAVKKYHAVAVGVPVKDTVKVVDHKNVVLLTPDRHKLWAVQTPQTFDSQLLGEAHELARRRKFVATDDAALVETFGHFVKIIEGSYKNIKITTPEDLKIAEAICKLG